jgi:membrane-associated protein
MPYYRYLAFDIFGGVFWVAAMILCGYSLGRSVPNIGQRIHYVIAVVIILSVMPAIISILRARHQLHAINANRSASIPTPEKE